jgi:hypothetical protein
MHLDCLLVASMSLRATTSPGLSLYARLLLLSCCRSFLNQYALPQRAYIGPTSMDPELAFLMTNMAQVGRPSDLQLEGAPHLSLHLQL